MKKLVIFCLTLCIALNAFSLVGCGNNSDCSNIKSEINSLINSEINSLRKELANIQEEAEETADALTKRIDTLETQLTAANEEVSSLRSEVTRLTELSTTMSQTITELSEIVKNEVSGNAALKAKLEELQTQYNQTETTIAELSSKVSSLETDVSELQTNLDTANTRLDIIESAVYVEPPVLQMGETFVLKSPTGIEMLKFRPVELMFNWRLDFNIERLNIPNTVQIDSYFTACIYSEAEDEYYYKIRSISSDFENAGEDFSVTYRGISFTTPSDVPIEDLTYIIIGLPSDNNLDDNQEKKYIIPYAIYML